MTKILLPYTLSFLLGSLVTRQILGNPRKITCFLFIFLAAGLGLGISAQLAFYSLLFFGELNEKGLMIMHMAIVLILGVISIRQMARAPKAAGGLNLQKPVVNRQMLFSMSAGFIFLILFHIHQTLGSQSPYGRWDGWAVWNMKSRFIILAGDAWQNIFQLHWHTQPDYPLLLVLANIWGWSATQGSLQIISATTSSVYAIATAGLLFAGLKRVIPGSLALLGSLLLFFTPPFLALTAAQYADIPLSFYLLAAIISLMHTLRKHDTAWAVLAGLCLGLMTFAKNEGVVMAALLWGIGVFNLIRSKHPAGDRRAVRSAMAITVSALIFVIPTFLLKAFFMPANRDIIIPKVTQIRHSFWEGITAILQEAWRLLADVRLAGLWILLLLMILAAWRRSRSLQTRTLSIFFLSYLGIVCSVYLLTVNFNLHWRLEHTFVRVMMVLLPSLLFGAFSACWSKEENELPLDE